VAEADLLIGLIMQGKLDIAEGMVLKKRSLRSPKGSFHPLRDDFMRRKIPEYLFSKAISI
jgi:hypothetical protein